MSRIFLIAATADLGYIVYLMVYKQMIFWPLFIPLFILIALWAFTAFYISKRMITKAREGDDFYFARASMFSKGGVDLTSGALATTRGEIIFYKRKGVFGGVVPIWSTSTSQIESYEITKVDSLHDGLSLKLKGERKPILFSSSKIKKEAEQFQAALGW